MSTVHEVVARDGRINSTANLCELRVRRASELHLCSRLSELHRHSNANETRERASKRDERGRANVNFSAPCVVRQFFRNMHRVVSLLPMLIALQGAEADAATRGYAVITGASSGIGEALARNLAARGQQDQVCSGADVHL